HTSVCYVFVACALICTCSCFLLFIFFFFQDTPTTEIYPLSLHDALPISATVWGATVITVTSGGGGAPGAAGVRDRAATAPASNRDRKSTRLNSSHEWISYAVFCLKKKKKKRNTK